MKTVFVNKNFYSEFNDLYQNELKCFKLCLRIRINFYTYLIFFTDLKLNASDILELEENDFSAYFVLGYQIQLKKIIPELRRLKNIMNEAEEKSGDKVNFYKIQSLFKFVVLNLILYEGGSWFYSLNFSLYIPNATN